MLDIIYDNTGKPYALNYDGTVYYYVLNLQGDVISIISRWGSTEGRYTYDAWGNIIAQSGDIASINPVRYRGYYYDSETGLYYLGSRYYDPQVRRFINADGAAFATFNTYSNGLTDKNYFAYCDNNPTSRSDDGGEFWSELLTGVAVVAGVTAVAAFVVATGGVGAMAVAGGGAVLSGAITSTTAMAVSVSAAAVAISARVYAKKFRNVETLLPQRFINTPLNSKGGKQNIRDSGLVGVSDEVIKARLKNPNTSKSEKQRLKKEQKARGNRNKQKRSNHRNSGKGRTV